MFYLQAPKPSPGPHKSRECLPLVVLLRNRLKYALTYREVVAIVMQRLISVDGKVRTDKCYPAGFMGKMRHTYSFEISYVCSCFCLHIKHVFDLPFMDLNVLNSV